MIITLDGQSGTGKSTLALKVAEKLGFKCLNTGMIYRAISYYLYKNNILPDMLNEISSILKEINIKITFKGQNQFVKINNEDCTPFVSSREVQDNVSIYSQILELREKVTSIQRSFATQNNIVVEGRDIGTHVFPNADFKFFVTCDIVVRAKRRLADLLNAGQEITLQQVLQSLQTRDALDSTRLFSPLKRADDAIDIDTTNSSIEETVEQILSFIK